MTVILMKNTAIGRRAYAISKTEADKMVDAGAAVQDSVHTGIYEEVTDGEREQGYMTRTLTAITPGEIKRRPGRPSKARGEEAPAAPVEEAPAAPVEE